MNFVIKKFKYIFQRKFEKFLKICVKILQDKKRWIKKCQGFLGYLGKFTKNISLLQAEEFDINVSASDKKRSIFNAILEAADYDEDFAKSNL